jgi:hypothetical protein
MKELLIGLVALGIALYAIWYLLNKLPGFKLLIKLLKFLGRAIYMAVAWFIWWIECGAAGARLPVPTPPKFLRSSKS